MRHFDIAAERRQRRPELMRKRGAELAHLADGVLEAFQSVVEGGGHVVQLVPCAPNRQPRGRDPLMLMVRVDVGEPRAAAPARSRAIHLPDRRT